MLSTASTLAQSALLALALALAWWRPRHRAVGAWLWLTTVYSFVHSHWISTTLARAPRPYHGGMRVALHATQLLYLLPGAVFAAVAWHAAGKRARTGGAAASAVLAVACGALVAGYGRAAGAYAIGPVAFRSATVYALAAAAFTAIAWTGILPRLAHRGAGLGRGGDDLRLARSDGDDAGDGAGDGAGAGGPWFADATLATVVVFAVEGTLRVGLPFVSASRADWVSVPALQLVATAVAIGVHVAAIAQADARARRAVSTRLAVARLRGRLAIARLRAASWGGRGDDAGLALPHLDALAARAGGVEREEARGLPRRHAVALEAVVLAAGTLPDEDARAVVAHAAGLCAGAAPAGGVPRWFALGIPAVAAAERHSEILVAVLGAVERLSPQEAQCVLGLAADLYGAVITDANRRRVRARA